MPGGLVKETTVWATVSLPGFHSWPGADGARGYLADRHRHLFGLRAEVSVTHSDRDVEFHDLSDEIRAWWTSNHYTRECGTSSCEDIAHELLRHLTTTGYTVRSVSVDEDQENGATITTRSPA